ncbi:MAG: DNA alkylation repair protein [Acidobacteriota bacterium]|nr:DNA alkylation repair protein [Acidobacteriota bacterium]
MPERNRRRPPSSRKLSKTPARPSSRRDLERALGAAADPRRAKSVAKFFKTAKGEYGEGDRFIGIAVPALRKIARQHVSLGLGDAARLLASPIHEYRLAALEILVAQYDPAGEAQRERIVAFYLRHTARMNNWDLVDAAASRILGAHLRNHPRGILDRLAISANLWERRIAMVATLALIRAGEVTDAHRVAEKLLGDEHDLIHKAVGWMLRETGKVDSGALLDFLRRHYRQIPRTTLRYAIERFPAAQRKKLLAGNFS